MTLHELLDHQYGPNGDALLKQMLLDGADVNERYGPIGETPLYVAARRYRCKAIRILLDHGAEIDARTKGNKTAYAHAVRRRFDDLAEILAERGADTTLNEADRFAVAIVNGQLDEAKTILKEYPEVARTGNPDEDRLLADVAGRNALEPVAFLIQAGADLTATGLDSGTPLHQAAWFGQPTNARLLIDAGAPLEIFEETHQSSPLGWAVHGSRYSGGADTRQEAYVSIVSMLLAAGAKLHYPDDPGGDSFLKRLMADATPAIKTLLQEHGPN